MSDWVITGNCPLEGIEISTEKIREDDDFPDTIVFKFSPEATKRIMNGELHMFFRSPLFKQDAHLDFTDAEYL